MRRRPSVGNSRTCMRTGLALLAILGTWSIAHHALAQGRVNFQIEIIPGPACFDGQDNDSDGFTDYPDDETCESASGTSEGTAPVSQGASPSGGGGQSLAIEPATSLLIRGLAYPGSRVILLQDGQRAATAIADASARFEISLSDLSAGDYLFLLFGESRNDRRSVVNPLTLVLQKGALTEVSGVVLTPTAVLDPLEVRRGDALRITGDAVPQATLVAQVFSDDLVNEWRFLADADGTFAFSLPTDGLADGNYQLKLKEVLADGAESGYGRARVFTVGDGSSAAPGACQTGDLNCDGTVDLVDFSIAAYWYNRPLASSFLEREQTALNGDRKMDLTDFSIMAYFWTG